MEECRCVMATNAELLDDLQNLKAARRSGALSVEFGNRKVTYRSETLGNVVADLNRYSRLPIVLEDKQLAQLRVTGRWSTTDLDVWLDSVAQALSLSVVRKQDEILLVPTAPSSRLPGGKGATAPTPPTVRR